VVKFLRDQIQREVANRPFQFNKRAQLPVSDATALRLADMLGTGTDGILWTYDFGAFPDSTYKFLDLTGRVKPYVLNRMNNNMAGK
jgi:hypothetical protein